MPEILTGCWMVVTVLLAPGGATSTAFYTSAPDQTIQAQVGTQLRIHLTCEGIPEWANVRWEFAVSEGIQLDSPVVLVTGHDGTVLEAVVTAGGEQYIRLDRVALVVPDHLPNQQATVVVPEPEPEPDTRLDINTATKAELTALPGIDGPRADGMLAARPYESVDAIEGTRYTVRVPWIFGLTRNETRHITAAEVDAIRPLVRAGE